MSAFQNWQQFAVHQRHEQTGCIPTGYEMLLRAAGATGIRWETFQEDVDLDKGRSADPQNNFLSVADKVRELYPHVVFTQNAEFSCGAEKLAFIEDRLSQQKPVLVSLPMFDNNRVHQGWHIMPVVDATGSELCLLKYVHADGRCETEWVKKEVIVYLHDNVPGGKEVGFLASHSPTA